MNIRSKFTKLDSLLKAHDWYYHQTEDKEVFKRGEKQVSEIKDLVKQLGADGERLHQAYRDIHINPANGFPFAATVAAVEETKDPLPEVIEQLEVILHEVSPAYQKEMKKASRNLKNPSETQLAVVQNSIEQLIEALTK